ncbi:MAG TPA: TrkH family potassium uptake protein [Longimicrobiales bacterium]|nr:TrkH family potassium uptake protein [Longimicrobiales bacterium]
MNARHLIHIVSIILLALAIALAVTSAVSAYYGDGDTLAFIISTVVTGLAGFVGYRRSSLDRDLSIREGYAVVSLSWIAIGIFGALPYLFTGTLASPTAALFESVSGFTTTGATVFAEIEPLPHGILFWRSLTQWIGGMGIIVLGIAILPFLGVGGMQLFRAEVPGPTPERLRPRITQTAKLLWLVYAGLTIAQVVLYVLGEMHPFEAVLHAFTTLSTGGFSPRTASIGAYDSAYIDYVTIIFMYLAGINFTLHFHALTGKPKRYFQDVEWRVYSATVVAATLLVLLPFALNGHYAALGSERAIRDSLFQVVSISTTTGFITEDYGLWPESTQLVLLLLMFIGGMAGSTAGGMKVIRVHAFMRQGITGLKRSLHPRAVLVTRVGRKVLRDDDLLNILGFILLFMLCFVAGALALTLLGNDLITSLGGAAAAIGNIGPGLGAVGATGNYGGLNAPTQIVLIFLMLVGRLEIFTILLLFHRDLWRQR